MPRNENPALRKKRSHPWLRCVSILLTLLVSTIAASAQDIQEIPKCKSSSTPAGPGCLEVNYDRFTDTTTRVLRFKMVEHSRIVILIITATNKGQPAPPVKPDVLAFVIVSVRRDFDRETLADRTLYILADTTRSRFDLLVMNVDTRDELLTEGLTALVTTKELRAMCSATKLEVRFRSDEFTFTSDQKENLQRFVRFYWNPADL